MATSWTCSCGIGDVCDARVMKQVAIALHDAPFLAIDHVIARAHTNYWFPLDNIMQGGSLCNHQVEFTLLIQCLVLLSNQLSEG
jgi:hypothetical protein